MKNIFSKALSVVLSLAMILSGNIGSLCVFTSYAETVQEKNATDLRISTPQLDELIRAVNLGFGDNVDDTSLITFAEYYRMLDKLVTLIAPDKLKQWQNQYPKARMSREVINRASAMYMLYAVAHDILGEEYCKVSTRFTFQNWGWLVGYMAEPWDDFDKFDYFPDFLVEEYVGGIENPSIRKVNAYFFCAGQSSCNGYFLFDYDKKTNSMRTGDSMTWQEAMWSVIRLYESVDPFEIETNWIPIDEVGSYNTEIITDELLSRAQYMVEPTTDNLPYFTGFHMGQLPQTGETVTEAKVRLMADLGFNYIRVCVSCLDFFDEEITQADEAYLQKLDEIVSWGLKYGLHISVQFFDYPGHIQYVNNETNVITADSDFYTNEVKQKRTIKLWQTIVKRYIGIPNSVLSFVTNHEPDNPARTSGQPFDPYTEEDIERVSKAVISAVYDVDPDRLQFYESRYDLCLDPFMADANVVFASIYGPYDYVYWNLNTDIDLTAGYVPEWPFYEIPSILNDDKQSYTVDGFLPAETQFDLHIVYTVKDAEWPTLTVIADGEEVLSKVCSNSDDKVSFSLDKKVDNLEIKIDRGEVCFNQFIVTLPEEYAREKYYFEGTDNAITAAGKVEKITTSVIDVDIQRIFGRPYYEFDADSIQIGVDIPWILNETGADLTITQDSSYTSRYGYNAEAFSKRAALYAKQREQYGVQGMNFELVTSAYVPVEETCSYLNDLLSAFKDNNIGWAMFYIQDIEAARHPNSVLEPVECGIFLDTKILEVLQKYQGERPEIMVEVPHKDHEYKEVTVDATYESDGYHSWVCKHCGDEINFEPYPRLTYSFYADIYENNECNEDTKEELGGFGTLSELKTAIEGKTGCLVLTLDKNAELSELPAETGLTSLIIKSKDGQDYSLTYTGTEMSLSVDTYFEADVYLNAGNVELHGNGKNLTLDDMALSGTSLITDETTLICANKVYFNIDISGLDVFSINECTNINNDPSNLQWTNRYGGCHAFINGNISGVKEFRLYGDSLYIDTGCSFSTDKVTGIYGNVFLKKTESELPKISVADTMEDMLWQIRIYALSDFGEGVYMGDEDVLCGIDEGMVIATIPTGADDSCVDKLGFMTGWDTWDEYSQKTYRDGKLYYGVLPARYTVVYNGNGSTSGSMDNQIIIYKSGTKLTANVFAKTGYTFTGWNTDENGNGIGYADKADGSMLSDVEGDVVTLYAQWTYIPVDVAISDCTITLSASAYAYDGNSKKPTVTVKDGTYTLVNGTDYTVDYYDNIHTGTATVTITGLGKYTGTATKTFTITATGKCGDNATWAFNSKTGAFTVTGTGNMYDYQYSSRTPWFKFKTQIKTVNIAFGITSVGTNAFYGCTSLTKVTGCANVTSIGINTFRNCTALTSVAGCSKVTTVNQYAFCGSTSFATLGATQGTVSLPAATKIGGYAFYQCGKIKILNTYSPLTYMGTSAFRNCGALTTATIGAGCKTIGSYAFCGDKALTSVKGCAGVTGIGAYAFWGDTALTKVAGMSKVTSVGNYGFYNCAKITTVGSSTGKVQFNAINGIGSYAFSGCKAMTYFASGSNLTQIGTYAFSGDSALATIYLKTAKLTTVGAKTFNGIKSTAVIYVPSSKLTAYKNGVLKGKGQAAAVTIKSYRN